MKVTWITVPTAALIGLAIGAFATGRVGGVVLPLLFVLACPLMVLFITASTAGTAGSSEDTSAPGPPEQRVRRSPVTSAPVRRGPSAAWRR